MMQVFNGLEKSRQPAAVALGCFDGLHKGHQAVIRKAVTEKANGLVPSVFTFPESPLAELTGREKPRLMSNTLKEKMLEDLGVEALYLAPFAAVKDLPPEAFVEEILKNTLRAEKVFCGYNYHFGAGGTAGKEELKALCRPRGIQVCDLPPVTLEGAPVSSTRIRKALEKGGARQARELLGHPFSYDFEVVHGRHIGHLMGTPTLNQVFPEDYLVPRYGVYASLVSFDQVVTYGVTNIGVKPTVGAEEKPLSETWMPDYDGEALYGKMVKTELLEFIRPEKRFGGLEELRAMILKNGEQARGIAEKEIKYIRKQQESM